jgi:hypothetical protein
MNANLLNVVNRIVAEQGEGILADAKRLFPFFADYVKNEYKEERVAFGRCIEYGAYQELKKTRTPDERQRLKAMLVDQINAKTGVDRPRCAEALDLLEMVIFKTVQQSTPAQSRANVCSKCGKELQKEWTSCPYCSTPVANIGMQTNWQESPKPETPVYLNNSQTQPQTEPLLSAQFLKYLTNKGTVHTMAHGLFDGKTISFVCFDYALFYNFILFVNEQLIEECDRPVSLILNKKTIIETKYKFSSGEKLIQCFFKDGFATIKSSIFVNGEHIGGDQF